MVESSCCAIGDVTGSWNSNRLHQVLGDLLVNALNYGSPESPVPVRLSGLEEEVVFSIHDQGEEIAHETLDRMFAPLARGQALGGEDGDMVLGLYVCREIVFAHGGEIASISDPTGTTFTCDCRAGAIPAQVRVRVWPPYHSAGPARDLRAFGLDRPRKERVNTLLKEIRHTPLLWLLVFVPVVFVAQRLSPDSHTLLFVLSVLAIVPLAALLSHATESVAAKTGDAIGGLLNATLGNLTELVIALTALHAGQYLLVKASIAGAIVTNTLFMLGASLLLGGLKHHAQEYNRISARMQAALLFLATVALLMPSAISGSTPAHPQGGRPSSASACRCCSS